MRIFLKLLSLLTALLLLFSYPVFSGPDDGTGLIKLAENASTPVWSPNGEEIIFTRNNAVTQGDPYYGWDIYKINTNNLQETQLTKLTYNEGGHVWSPDGTSILYGYDAIDDFYLYIMSSDGSNNNFELAKQSYEENFAGISGCAWSPDGSKIAYISHYHEKPDRLIILNPDGSNKQTIASAGEISALSWAPDSSRIAFNAAYSENRQTYIYLIDSDVSGPVFLTEGEIRQQTQPWQSGVWSADGSKILYSSKEGRNSDIYVINTFGREKKRLTDDNSEDYSPCFSPDGSRIIFISTRKGYDSLWIMDSKGDHEEELTEDFEGIYDFSWNPDGQKVAFSSGFNAYVQEIGPAGNDDKESPEESDSPEDQDTDDDHDHLHLEIISPGMNFAAIQGTPELVSVRITKDSGNSVQSSGFKYIRAIFSNGDPELQLFDDGAHHDIAAGDGIFSNQWSPVNINEEEQLTFCTLGVSADHESLGSAEQIISGSIFRKPTLPDLRIEDISWDPATPSRNDKITFRIIASNSGSGASETCKAKCYINGNEVYSYSFPGLEAGSVTTITFNWIPTASGNMDVKAVLDAEKQVSESEEENNEKAVSFSVKSVTSASSPGSSSSDGGGSRSSSSSSSGGGAAVSPEPASNIRIKELSQQYITNGKHVKFTFPKNVTCITYVAFDSKRTAGKTTTIVEMLENKSTHVPGLPSGQVYENMNIWVGNKGTAGPENIENAVVGFRVGKSWITSNDVDPALVRFWRFSSGEWEDLSIRQLGEDERYCYFEAQTSGFSSFAITALPAENETIVDTSKASVMPSVRSSADVMGELFGKLMDRQNSNSLEISTVSLNVSNPDPEDRSIARGAGERITGRGVIRVLAIIALLSVTGYLGSLILKKQD